MGIRERCCSDVRGVVLLEESRDSNPTGWGERGSRYRRWNRGVGEVVHIVLVLDRVFSEEKKIVRVIFPMNQIRTMDL
jgi:hypothetical protein